MADIILLLMTIASATSLLVVSPRGLQRKAILALREHEEMELSHAHGRDEDGQTREIPMNSRSDPTRWRMSQARSLTIQLFVSRRNHEPD
jgi:hypothetical protein